MQRLQGAGRTALQCQQEFFRCFEALALVQGHGLEHHMVQPDRHLGVVPAGRCGVAVVAAHLVGQHLAIRQPAGEQLVQGHAQGKQIALGSGQLLTRAIALCRLAPGRSAFAAKAPLLRVHIIWGARVQGAHGRGLAPGEGHAQVQHAQHAVVAQVQVGGFDVAVHHALAVQPRQRLERLHGVAQRRRGAHALLPVQNLLQGFAAMPVVQHIKRRALLAIR